LILGNDTLFWGNLFTSASTIRTCTLLDKPGRRMVPFEPDCLDYVGVTIPDHFVLAMDEMSRKRIVTCHRLPFTALSTAGERMLRNCHRAVAYDMLETDTAALLDATPPDSEGGLLESVLSKTCLMVGLRSHSCFYVELL
jgi:hypothetical protein